MPKAALTIERPAGGGLVVAFAGELDVASVESLVGEIDAVLARDDEPLLVDLSELTFMDSSGIAVLLRLANRFSSIEVRHASSLVRRAIEVLALSDRLGMDGD